MSIRDWVLRQLRKDSYVVQAVGEHGVEVLRRNRPDAFAYCVEPDSATPVTVEDLEDAVEELPQAGMVIVTRRAVDPGVHERARELDVSVDTFGGFQRALWEFDDISEYVHPEETYFRRRMAATRVVTSVTRRGHRAWELERVSGLRPLMVVTHHPYELTDDAYSDVLNGYPKLDLDALVITNPSARGFGARVAKSALRAGVPLYTLHDFIDEIDEPWT